MVAWFVGNCAAKSGRFEYIKRLQQHIPVDVYGSCGNLTCTVNNETACRIMMAKNYKFYIAFENSLCLDYVTEKLFYNAQFDVIPVVLDLHGQYARFVPAKSYINALDFPSVKDLANYLKVLDKNDTLYNEYFLWKEHYFMEYSFHGRPALRNRIDPTAHGICGLCSKLHNPSEPVSVYRNLTKWWLNDAACSALKFPSESVENDTWIAVDYHPPYNVRAPYRWA